MRIRNLSLILLCAILAGIIAYVLIYFAFPVESPGQGYSGGSSLHYVWVPIVTAFVTFLIGLLVYYALFPEIKREQPVKPEQTEAKQALEATKKVLKEDEWKIVELILNSGGKMLQRDIARESGFSRVKTHRILYRLSSRGIVVAEKHYNTYMITLADWLVTQKSGKQLGNE